MLRIARRLRPPNVAVADLPGVFTYHSNPARDGANDIANELWNSMQAAVNRDQAGIGVKFAVPTIVNGRVYIGTRTEVDVYGLLP